jgi:nucleoside-diphosphate-sugar epimerase
MRVLITGGAGFIGSNIANQLAKDDIIKDVIVLDNLSNGSVSNLIDSLKINFIEGDICDYKLVSDICKNVDIISHQAACGSVPKSIIDPINFIYNNVYGFTCILQAARDNQVKKIIYATSSSVYGDNELYKKNEKIIGNPLSPYALSKRFDEMLADNFNRLYGINFYGLRYFNVFGENQRFDSEYSAVIPKFIDAIIKKEQPVIYGDGEQRRDFTYIKNVVDFNVDLIKKEVAKGSHIYNVGAGKSTSVNEIFSMIRNKLKSDINPRYTDRRNGDILNSLADIDASVNIGYIPKIDVEEGIEKTIEWFKNKNKNAGY